MLAKIISLKAYIIIFITSLCFIFPFFLNSELLLARNNDLQEFFWPIYYFVKESILGNQTVPLWNNLFLAGTPLLPDPQFPIFYLPNIIFIFFPLDSAFIISLLTHNFLAGVGMYLFTRFALNYSLTSSIFCSIIYLLSPTLAGFIEAGHIGLINTFTWIPYLAISLMKILEKNSKLEWIILMGITLANIFLNHPIIFLLSLFSSVVFILIYPKSNLISKVPFLIGGIIFTLGLITLSLLPQLEWQNQTTRELLLKVREVHPQWYSLKEYLLNIFLPWINGINEMGNISTEKWIFIPISTFTLALVGFISLKKEVKKIFVLSAIFFLLISLNNLSIIYPQLINFDLYVLMRISTRVWIILPFIIIILAGWGLENLLKRKLVNVSFILIIILFAISESLFISWKYLNRPIPRIEFAPKEIYEFISQDSDKFRVFCTTRCLSQKKSALYHLELIEGYNTLQQKNFYQQTWQFTGKYWNYYTLAIPPMGITAFEKINPDLKSLGEFNTKYIISPYKLGNQNLTPVKEIDNYFIYKNSLYLPRVFSLNEDNIQNDPKITFYKPNFIRVEVSSKRSSKLILSEVYSKGWRAYLNGTEQVPIQERPNVLRLVDLKKDTKYVDFIYQPSSFQIGIIITLITFVSILILSIFKISKLNEN